MRAVNLIPAEQRSGASVGAGRSQGGAYAVLGMVAGLALMAVLYGRAHHQVASGRAQVAAIAAETQRAEAAAQRLAPYTSFLALREQRTQDVETLLDSRFDWAHVFHEFGRVLPSGTSISSLTGTVGASTPSGGAPAKPAAAGAGATSATPPGSVPAFTLIGCATSQPVVAQTLQRLRLIDGVSEVTLESSTSSAASAAGGGASGGCPAGAPAFTMQVTFDPLPSASAVAAATKTVADTTHAGSPTGTATTTGTTTAGVSAR
jgi:hypothetical protein